MKFLLILPLLSFGLTYADSPKFHLDDPPFYIMTFEEIQNLQYPLFNGAVNQKDFYLKETSRLLRSLHVHHSIKSLYDGSVDTLNELSGDETRWNKVRENVYQFCQSIPVRKSESCTKQYNAIDCKVFAHNGKICKDLIEARIKTFSIYSGSHGVDGDRAHAH